MLINETGLKLYHETPPSMVLHEKTWMNSSMFSEHYLFICLICAFMTFASAAAFCLFHISGRIGFPNNVAAKFHADEIKDILKLLNQRQCLYSRGVSASNDYIGFFPLTVSLKDNFSSRNACDHRSKKSFIEPDIPYQYSGVEKTTVSAFRKASMTESKSSSTG